jgi:hypothetical protein
MTKINTFGAVRGGDMVSFRDRFGILRRGRAQPLLCNPEAGTVVLNMGGMYGTPVVVTPKTFVSADRR